MKRILYLAVVFVLVGCTSIKECTKQGTKQGTKPVVAVSIAPIKWVVENIADTLVDIEIVVPEAVGAENYDPSPRQIARLNESDVYFKIGLLDFEKDLVDANSVNLCDDVEILGDRDPHVWLSVRNMRTIAKHVHSELLRLFPKDSAVFNDRYITLDSKLEDLDHRFSQQFSGDENVLIVHPSLTYLASDYGFSQIAVEVDGKEPSAAYLKTIFDAISQKGIKRIYYSVQDNPNEAEAIALEAGIEAVKYDPLSADWYTELDNLVKSICSNL